MVRAVGGPDDPNCLHCKIATEVQAALDLVGYIHTIGWLTQSIADIISSLPDPDERAIAENQLPALLRRYLHDNEQSPEFVALRARSLT